MLHVNKAFDKYEFKHHNKSARVLSGKEEGAFGWITVNVLKKTFDDGEVNFLTPYLVNYAFFSYTLFNNSMLHIVLKRVLLQTKME